jgi:lipopolysaccharide transport system permease protein
VKVRVLNDGAPAERQGGEEIQAVQDQVAVVEIRSYSGILDLNLAAVWQFRQLLSSLIIRDLKVLYRQAALGIAWAVLQPAFIVIVFTIIFGKFARLPSDGIPYPVFAFAAVLPWNYFAEAVRRSTMGLLQDAAEQP